MWRLGPHNRTLLRLYRFADPRLEAQYFQSSMEWCLAPFRLYFFAALVISIEGAVTWFPLFLGCKNDERCDEFNPTPIVWIHLTIASASVALLTFSFLNCSVRRYPRHFHLAFCCIIAMLYAALMSFYAFCWIGASVPLYRLEEVDDGPLQKLQTQLTHLVRNSYGRMAVNHIFFYSFSHWITLALTGLSYETVIAYICVFTAYLVGTFITSHVEENDRLTALFAASLCTIATGYISIVLERVRRSHFLANVLLTRELQASQMADSILNHRLKNTLADVAGNIELFLAGEADGDVLEDGILSLRRGIKSCKERQVYLRLVSGEYQPVANLVNLKEFGQQLTAGRAIHKEFVDAYVYLDSTLCDLILENALSNAFKHGSPDNPHVTFAMSLLPNDDLPPDHQQLRFQICNTANPLRVKLTDAVVRSLFAGEATLQPDVVVPTLSDGIGLTHCMVAAKLGGITLSLSQQDNVVTFIAQMNVKVTEAIPLSISTSRHTTTCFPCGLHFLCLDDSPAARRLLDFHIRKGCDPGSVKCLGAQESDVEAFVHQACNGADVVIVDQNLEYSKTYHGTHIVKQLLTMGFQGLICIRSGDDTTEDRAQYAQAGAHCTLGKELPGTRMLEEIKFAYMQLQQPPVCSPTSPDASSFCNPHSSLLLSSSRPLAAPLVWQP